MPTTPKVHGAWAILFAVVIAVILIVSLVSGLVALFSPRRWFELPEYLALRGSLRRTMLDSGWGRLQIRAYGMISVLFMSWMGFLIVSGAIR